MHRIKKDAVFLLDASYLLYRSYYAIKPLQTSTGIPTQATFGFCRTLKKLMNDFKPSNIIVVWDHKGKTFRSEIYKEYKETRQAPPSDLFVQKEHIQQILEAMEICQISKEGFEADDVIGALVHKYADSHQVVMVCPDKDLYQLMAPHLLIFDPFKNKLYDKKEYEEEIGFKTEKLPFYFSLLGDTSDNIPGVRGIGKKTAFDLVTKFKSLDDLYENIEKIEKERTKKLLTEGKENAYLSHKLFILKPFPIKVPKGCMELAPDCWSKAVPLFQQLEFKGLAPAPKQHSIFDAGMPQEQAPDHKLPEHLADIALPGGEPTKELIEKEWKCIIVETEDGLETLYNELKNAKEMALDTETSGVSPLQDKFVGLSFAVNEKEAYYIPFLHPKQEGHTQLDVEVVLDKLRPILEDENFHKIMHSAKFDELVLENAGVTVRGMNYDTLLAASLLRVDQKINLKDLSAQYLSEPMTKFKVIMGKTYKSFDQVPLEVAAPYGARDSLQTLKLKNKLEPKLKKEKKLLKIFNEVDLPLQRILVDMEKHGIKLDVNKIKEITKEVDRDLKKIIEKIEAAIGASKIEDHEINLNSPRQIEVLLFDKLELPVVKKSAKGKRSTDIEVLEKLQEVHPIPGMIIKYRELTKLKSTYLEPLPTYVNPKTGCVHTSYSQTMVATSRLSSSSPNLQNIPIGKSYGTAVRSAFVAPRGYRFISADYAQVELRILADLSGDKNLQSVFADDSDIHVTTASQILDIDPKEVTHDQRQLGKRINYSITYGLTPFGLARDIGISPKDAKLYIDKYFESYPKVAAWMDKMVEFAQEHGYVETILGRRRYIPKIKEKNKSMFEAARRVAINSPVQGSQAEIIKMAMIELHEVFKKKKLDAKIILQIHDELLVQVKNDDLEATEKVVKTVMEGVVDWKIPLKVSLRHGKDWGEVSK